MALPAVSSSKTNNDNNNAVNSDNNEHKSSSNNNDEKNFIVETETVDAPVASTLLTTHPSIIASNSPITNQKDIHLQSPLESNTPMETRTISNLDNHIVSNIPLNNKNPNNNLVGFDNNIVKDTPINNIPILPDNKIIPRDLHSSEPTRISSEISKEVITTPNNLIDNNPLSSHVQNQSLPLKNKKSSLLIDSNLATGDDHTQDNITMRNNIVEPTINESADSSISNETGLATPSPLMLNSNKGQPQSTTSIRKIINNEEAKGQQIPMNSTDHVIKELPLDSKRTAKSSERPAMHSMNSRDVLMTEKKGNPLVMSNGSNNNSTSSNNSTKKFVIEKLKDSVTPITTTNANIDNNFIKQTPTVTDHNNTDRRDNINKFNSNHQIINKSTDHLAHHAISTDDLHSQLDDSSQKPTKTDFFAARLASAVGENEVSDSEETFVYESAANSTKNRIYPSSSNHVPQIPLSSNNTQHPSTNGTIDVPSTISDREPQHGVVPKMSVPLLNNNKKLMTRLKNPRHISTSGIPVTTGPNNIVATGSHLPTNFNPSQQQQQEHIQNNAYHQVSGQYLPQNISTEGNALGMNNVYNPEKMLHSPTIQNSSHSATTPVKLHGSPNVNHFSNTHGPIEDLLTVRSFNKNNRGSNIQDNRPARPYILDYPKSPNKRSSIASLTKSNVSQQSTSHFSLQHPQQQILQQNVAPSGNAQQRPIPTNFANSLRQMASSSLQHNNSIGSGHGIKPENKKGLRTTVSKIFDTNETPLRIYSGVPDNVNLEDYIDQSDHMANSVSSNNNGGGNTNNVPMLNHNNNISGSIHNHSMNGLNNQNSVRINNYMNSNDGKRAIRNSLNGYQQYENNDNPYANDVPDDNGNNNEYQNYRSHNNKNGNNGDFIYNGSVPIREEDETEYSTYRNSMLNSNGNNANTINRNSNDTGNYSTQSNGNSSHIRNSNGSGNNNNNNNNEDDLQSMFYYNHRANLEARPEISDYEDDDDDVGEDDGGNRSFFARHNFLPAHLNFQGSRHPSYSYPKQPPVQGTFYEYNTSPSNQYMNGQPNEYTPLRNGMEPVGPNPTGRRRYSRNNGGNGYSPHDFYGKKSTWSKFKSAIYFSFVMTILVTIGFVFGFIIATNKELQDFNIVLVDNVISTTDELLFDITASAFNPGFFSISINDGSLDIFAKSKHVPEDDDGGGNDGDNDKEDNRNDDNGDSNTESQMPSLKSKQDSAETVFLGTISKLVPELKFSGGFFNRKYDVSMTSLKIKKPGTNDSDLNQEDPDGSEKWEEIIKYDYDLIIRGNLHYKIPFFNNDRSIAIQRTAKVPKNERDDMVIAQIL
ncbi:hypothetical protein C6P45_005277 [Maudiozyma exigua]|uniref:Vacuolar segregation protein 7 n=1 Tax=Maudiozyma exigua TaxID=34358 RepID=A0A9P6WBC8_MAUEX|nr:hypothetical protein C6P45_005277 [Kazachstania exigua]